MDMFHIGFRFWRFLTEYGRYFEMAQKDIEGCHVTFWHMHVILRWLKVRTIQFLFNFCSKYWSRVKILRWLTFFSSKILRWLKIRIIFASNSISLRTLSHLKITCIYHHVTWHPSMSFWAISKYLPYISGYSHIDELGHPYSIAGVSIEQFQKGSIGINRTVPF